MFTGQMKRGDQLITWMYDCGSKNLALLEKEIDRLSISRLDYLFLSHLDQDHVNGLKHLLKRGDFKIGELILPYFNAEYFLVQIARAAEEGDQIEDLVELAIDTEGWFRAQGFQGRLLYVKSPFDPEGDGDRKPGSPGPEDLGSHDRAEQSRSRRGEDEQATPPEPITGNWKPQLTPSGQHGRSQGSTAFAEHANCLYLTDATNNPIWILQPYVLMTSHQQLTKFANKILIAFNKKNLNGVLKELKKNPTNHNIKQLKGCYTIIQKKHNLISMILFSGPDRNETIA